MPIGNTRIGLVGAGIIALYTGISSAIYNSNRYSELAQNPQVRRVYQIENKLRDILYEDGKPLTGKEMLEESLTNPNLIEDYRRLRSEQESLMLISEVKSILEESEKILTYQFLNGSLCTLGFLLSIAPIINYFSSKKRKESLS